MGQRLVVNLWENEKVIASVYYHWSAYFASTIFELAKLSEAILDAEKEGKNKLLAILEKLEEDEEYKTYNNKTEIRCGGVRGTPEDIEAAKKLFPDHKFKDEHVNRNCGIISFTEEGIQNFETWEEGHADIYLDTHEIINNVILDPEPFELKGEIKDELGIVYGYESGKVSLNGQTCPVNAFECTCESVIELCNFMDEQYNIYYLTNFKPEGGLQ